MCFLAWNASLLNFKRSLDLQEHLLDTTEVSSSEYNPRLYVNTTWDPDPCGEPLASSFTKFEHLISDMRKALPTYWRFNLRPIHCQALSSLQRDKMIIIYPSNKNLGSYIVHRPNCIRQCLHEHLLSTNNYRQLSPSSTHQELHFQENVLIQQYKDHEEDLSTSDQIYFKRSFQQIAEVGARMQIFYGTWKIHKKNTSKRKIVWFLLF